MPNPIAARKNASFKATSSAPSFNKTQVGNTVIPLPYQVKQELNNSVGIVPSVRLNGDPAYVLTQSSQPSCEGDGKGKLLGVKSQTLGGEVKPILGSTTVNMGKHPIIRDGDPCTMQGGNTLGTYSNQAKVSPVPPSLAGNGPTNTQPATPEEKGFFEQAADALKNAGQFYKDNISAPLHGFAGDAMNTGGTIAAVGGTTAAVGGGMVLTGIGAAPGVVITTAGGATAVVGGGVGAVGGIAETAATGLDAAAGFLVSGQLPNATALVTAYAQRMIMAKISRLTNFIPGKPKKTAPSSDGKPDTNKPDANKPEPPKSQGGSGRDGTTVQGKGDGGRCRLRPYKDGCPGGQTPHHVVPDHCFKQPGDNGAYYNGAIKHADGLSVCVDGSTKSTGANGGNVRKDGRRLRNYYGELAQHGQIHARFDAIETGLGKIGNPTGTASLGQLEDVGAGVVSQVTGCNKEDLKKQLRNHHQSKGLPADTKLRADPFGKAKSLDSSIMGVPNQGGATGRGP